jgi:type II secretory pathway component PulK
MLALGAMVVVLGLAAALDAYVSARVEQATLIRARLQDSLDAYSTRATVFFLLGTQRFTRAGLTTAEEPLAEAGDTAGALRIDPVGGELSLDGRVYAGMGRVRFALQDEAGMVALNSASPQRLEGLLTRFDDTEGSVATLLDTLEDYRDGNTLKRLNGAEREEYAAAGLPPPSDRDLRSAPEILQILGWREWFAARPEFRLHAWLSAGHSDAFNPNVVPASLLEWLPGMAPATAARVVDEREREPFRSVPDFKARVDVELPVDDEQYRFFSSDALRLTLWAEGSAHAEVLAIQSTPLDPQAPWQIDSIYSISRPPQDIPYEVPGQYFSPRAPAAR